MNAQSVDIGFNMPTPKPTVISLFAGCGGSSLGYHMAGYKELLAIDFDDNAIETFKLNFEDVPIWKTDISQLSGTKIMDFCKLKPGELDLLDGSPPCQGYSTAGKRQVCDVRNDLVNQYIRIVKTIQPKIFVMENVSGMVKGKMKGLFIEYVKAMKSAGYQVSCRLLNAKWFSVPQSRQRIICIGVRNDLNMMPVFPKAHDRVITVGEALHGFEQGSIQGSQEFIELWNKTPPGKPLSVAHPKQHWFNDLKLHKNKPAPTILKTVMKRGGNGLNRWDIARKLTISELKQIASFPDDFKFVGRFEQQWARIGNSVPPLMIKAIAETIRDEILMKVQ